MSFDPLVANSGRLEILTALAGEAAAGSVEFVRLRRQTRLTDGNLASHAKRLRSAGLIEVHKQFRDGKPLTQFAITPVGRAALERHARRLLDAIGGRDVVAVTDPVAPGGRESDVPPSSLPPVAAGVRRADLVADPDHDDAEDDWID